MIYDVLIVPRHQGKYEIPPVELTYFDTSENAYKTIKSEGFTLDVAKGSGAASVSDFSGQDLQELSKDIRYIKLGDTRQRALDDFFFGSTAYWISLVVLALIFITLFIVFRQRAIDNANVTKMRGKKANKVATKRLKQAAKLMQEGKASAFYDEVLRALWGYVGDKLNIPVEQLSHDNISQKLSERSVDADTVGLFIGALDECEFERYAPGDPKGNMNKVYEKAMTAISQIEGLMKHHRSAKTSAVLLLLLLLPLGASAVTKTEADSAYVRGQYQQAISDYEELLKQGGSAELYYNLGNAYYRTENITKAVLNYERALLLSPGDRDIRFNLQIARSKTIDKIVPESEMFFITWYHALVNLMSVDAWARVALISLTLVIVLLLVYLFASRLWLRKVGFFGGFLLLAVFVLSNLFAWQQKQNLLFRKGAIITAPSVTVKSTPAKNGTDLFILHEGTKVNITDSSMRGWLEIRIADGKEGWIERNKLEEI
jgi:tetratricopeptide (TPR) repeat protein